MTNHTGPNTEIEDDDDDIDPYIPKASDFRPKRATWSGHLFENPNIGMDPGLWLGLEIQCEELPEHEALGSQRLSVAVEWMPFEGASYRNIAGMKFEGEEFGEPIEPTVYFDGMHHCFDEVTVEVLEQRNWTADFRVSLRGDVDGLGVEELGLTVTAEFEGIAYGLDTAGRLAEFTDTTGLVQHEGSNWFKPA